MERPQRIQVNAKKNTSLKFKLNFPLLNKYAFSNRIFYSDEDVESDDERSARKAAHRNQLPDTRERIAIDISILKKQYIKLRERQRQATISNASKQPKQPQSTSTTTSNVKATNINQYLIGRNAIVSSKGKRIGPPAGAIPPARVAAPTSVSNKYRDKRMRNATIATVDNASTSALLKLRGDDNSNLPRKSGTLLRKRSESSSYSEDSEKGSDDELDARTRIDSSSSDTSLCDEEYSMEASSVKSRAPSSASDESERQSFVRIEDPAIGTLTFLSKISSEEYDNRTTDSDNGNTEANQIADTAKEDKRDLDLLNLPNRSEITSTSQLSPIGDISNYLGLSSISPLKTPTSYLLNSYPLCEVSTKTVDDAIDDVDPSKANQSNDFQVSDEGVTNAYFERVTHVTTADQESASSLLFENEIVAAPSGSKSMEFVRDHRNESPSEFSDSDDKSTDVARLPRQKNDLILKIIEENSRILDRIMMKNTQSSIVSMEPAVEKTRVKECNDTPQQSSPELEKIDENVQLPAKSVQAQAVTYPDIIISSDSANEMKENAEAEEECISINKFSKPTEPDDHIFKYGDLSDCISKYLTNSIENTGKLNKSENEQIEPIEAAKPNDAAIIPETPSTLALLVTDHDNPDDLKDLLKQSFIEYSKSPSESLSIDSKLENDLETLLKMSAELLRDEFPVRISSLERLDTSAIDPVILLPDAISLEMTTSMMPDENNETVESNRSSAYLDAEALQIEMESVAGDISATISSIKNTIKSIDSLCQDDDRRSRERTDKTLDDIIKVVEKLDEEKVSRSRSRERNDTSPFRSMSTSHAPRTEPRIDAQSNSDNSRYLASARMSRDRNRITSIGRRKDDDFGEYESRVRRNKSPIDDDYRKDDLDRLSASQYRPLGSTNTSPYKIGGKLELRHTTVTSTFYDRFLSQKYEEKYRMDRSPSSPVINKAYLNTLKPTSGASYHSDRPSRPSKSNETSPVNLSTRPKSTYIQLPQFPMSSISRDSYTRSCDNILTDLNATSSKDVGRSTKYSNVTETSRTTDDSYDIDKMLKRHSTGACYQTTSPLPTKPKKPSELGIKLGLYKPT